MSPTHYDEERIPEDLDMYFTTSLGHWTGEAVWFLDPTNPDTHVAMFYFPPGTNAGKVKLQYPHILIEPTGGGDFTVWFSTHVPPDDLTLTLTLSDGNYSFSTSFHGPPYEWTWPTNTNYATPDDWNKESAYIEIKVEATSTQDSSAFIYAVHFTENWSDPEKRPTIQYLPLVGIG